MSTISASTLTTTALQLTADTTGALVFKTGATPTTALTLNADQSATFAGAVSFATASFTNLSYTGTLTGGTGVINIGSGQFYKDASGNVGIGTTSPGAPLDFGSGVGSSGAINKLSLYNSSGPQYGFGISSLSLNYVTGSSASHAWWTGGGTGAVQIMTLNSLGNLGIGTTSPLSKLDVEGTNADTYITVGANNSSTGAWTVGLKGVTASYGVDAAPGTGSVSFVRVSNGNNDIVFSPSAATLPVEKMRLTTGGVLNIGSVFYVYPTGGSAAITGPMLYNTSANSMGLVSSGTQPIVFGQNNLEVMRVDSSGNLAINTTGNLNYSAKLKVYATSNQQVAEFYGAGSNNQSKISLTNDNSGCAVGSIAGNLVFYANDAATERMRISSAGYIGINTSTPVGQIDINRGTTGIRQPNSYGTAINFAGGRSAGGSAATGTMLTVNFSAVTYFAATLHIFSTAYALNGGGPASGMIGAYDIINIISESAGSTYNITRVSGPALTYGGSTVWNLSGGIASKIFTLTGAVSSAGQSGFLFTGYMVYGGQGPSPTNIILTSYDMATTQVWGA